MKQIRSASKSRGRLALRTLPFSPLNGTLADPPNFGPGGRKPGFYRKNMLRLSVWLAFAPKEYSTPMGRPVKIAIGLGDAAGQPIAELLL